MVAHTSQIRWTVGFLVLCFAAGLPAPGQTSGAGGGKPISLSPPSPPMSLAKQSIHAQNRISYGPTPEQTADIDANGLNQWIVKNLDASFTGTPARLQTLLDKITLPVEHNPASATGNLKNLAYSQIAMALYSQNQLQEQMANFWEQHFNVYHRAVRNFLEKKFFADDPPTADRYAVYYQWLENRDFRDGALGHFEDLLILSATGLPMMSYLNTAVSQNPTPNQNYARELLELHTVGVANYEQADVIEASRLFTSLEIRWLHQNDYGDPLATPTDQLIGDLNGDGAVGPSDLALLIGAFGTASPEADLNGDGTVNPSDLGLLLGNFGIRLVLGAWFNEADYNAGAKTVFANSAYTISVGGSSQTAAEKYGEITSFLTQLARSELTARYVSAKLVAKFVAPYDPDLLDAWPADLQSLVETCVTRWLATDGHIRDVLEVIFDSELFLNPAYRYAKTETPLESAVSSIRAFEANDLGSGAATTIAQLERVRATIVDQAHHPFFQVAPPTGFPEERSPGSGNLRALIQAHVDNVGGAEALNFDWAQVIPPSAPADVADIADRMLALLYGTEGFSQIERDLAIAFLNDYLNDLPPSHTPSHEELCAHLAAMVASYPTGFLQ